MINAKRSVVPVGVVLGLRREPCLGAIRCRIATACHCRVIVTPIGGRRFLLRLGWRHGIGLRAFIRHPIAILSLTVIDSAFRVGFARLVAPGDRLGFRCHEELPLVVARNANGTLLGPESVLLREEDVYYIALGRMELPRYQPTAAAGMTQ